ncbi:hypothetical protein TrRE_jg11230 [Triparma retinervis]|uniref:peptidylprolyl isomerase n=1 Tax=Triparma retinervis TaxID=2557542 RepID=A0A9W7EBA0_9STRA|nr:hypothetical protein TrRE_jg11230 [Triparma retinervis]
MRASEHAMGGGSAAAHRYVTGKTSTTAGASQPLPFDCCALTLNRYEEPVASPAGVVYSGPDIVPYLMKNKNCPVLGTPLRSRDLIKLNMIKDDNKDWTCPVLGKRFTNSTKVVMVVNPKDPTSANVFSHQSVSELNFKAKNFYELIDGFKFSKKDVVVLQDPSNEEVCKRRDISRFKGAKEVQKSSSIQQSVSMQRVMAEVKKKREENGGLPPTSALPPAPAPCMSTAATVFSSRPPILTSDLFGLGTMTNNAAASSLTSTATASATSTAARHASQFEVEDAAFAYLKSRKGKKSFGLLRTSMGDVHIEMDSDIAPRTVMNAVYHANAGYYDGCIFHRVIGGFMNQTGDPTGTGKGGNNVWNSEGMEEEFDDRLKHDKYAVSMANAGPGTGKSQFFITSKVSSGGVRRGGWGSRAVGQ